MTKKREKLSIVIPTRDVDFDIVQGALLSVSWADEILIADSSTTKEGVQVMRKLAKKHNANFIHRQYNYSADFKNWAIPKARHDWIFLLDSDEVATNKLRKTIQELLLSEKIKHYDGFEIARKHFFFGNFLRWSGRYPLYQVRLFRKTCRYEDRDVHAHIILDKKRLGKIKPKKGDMLHFSDRSFAGFFERFNRYSTYQANYMKKVADKSIGEVEWIRFLTEPLYFKAVIKDVWFFVPFSELLRFFWMYIIKLGFLDGRNGLSIAILYGFQDYVSKTKYYFLTEKKERTLRTRIQKITVNSISKIITQKNNAMKSCQYSNLNLNSRGVNTRTGKR